MKVALVFEDGTEKAKARFQTIYRGFIIGWTKMTTLAERRGESVGIDKMRLARDAKAALVAVSAEVPASAETDNQTPIIEPGDADRALSAGVQAVVLTVDQRNLVKSCVESVNWRANALDVVIDAIDFLGNAVEVANDATPESVIAAKTEAAAA